MELSAAPFKPRDLVRLSPLGRERLKSPPGRTGVVIRVSATGQQVTLRWFGLKGRTVLHWTYLERVNG
jgi:hypothetical protein